MSHAPTLWASFFLISGLSEVQDNHLLPSSSTLSQRSSKRGPAWPASSLPLPSSSVCPSAHLQGLHCHEWSLSCVCVLGKESCIERQLYY